jgi:membrane protein
MKIKFSGLKDIFVKTFKGWNADDPFRQSSVIAYYAIFSLPALLVLIINVAGFFFGQDAVTGEISRQFQGIMGAETAQQVTDIISKAQETKAGVISSIIAIITIIFGATGVFVELQKTLNQIWDVRQKPNSGFKNMIKSRLLSFGLILSIGFLLLVSLVISSVLSAMSHWLEAVFPEGIAYLFYVVEFIVSLAVISLLFALMFRFLPDARIKWREVMIGAVLTGLLFILGKYGLSFYFGKADPGSAYGAAGTIILIMLWASYSSMIVFFGAEFTKQYSLYHGVAIEPTANAEKIKGANEGMEGERKQSDTKKNEAEAKHHEKAHGKHHSKKGHHSLKSKKELEDEVLKLERALSMDKEGIKDNLKPSHFFSHLIPKAFRKDEQEGQHHNADSYLRSVAKKHIVPKTQEDSWLDKLRHLFQPKKAQGH